MPPDDGDPLVAPASLHGAHASKSRPGATLLLRMGLKLLCAGCSKEEREHAETQVRQALGRRAEGGPWTVSVVKVGGQWSVTLDGPSSGVRSLTLVAPQGRLRETIVDALAAPAPAGRARSAQGRSPLQCEKCRKTFVVVYEALPDEGEESVPVACPHCWQVNHVLVAESAAEAKDYRAEKA